MFEHHESTYSQSTNGMGSMIFLGSLILLILWVFQKLATPSVGRAVGWVIFGGITLACAANWSTVDRFIAGAF